MIRSFSSRLWILCMGIVLILGVVACERPLHEEVEDEVNGSDPAVLVPGADGYVDPAKRSLPLVTDGSQTEAYPGPETDAQGAVEEPAELPTPTPEPEPIIYEVQSGDTLLNISRQFDVSIEDIAAASGLTDVDVLDVGQRLVIPVDGFIPQNTVQEAPGEAPADEAPAAEAPESEAPAPVEPAEQIHVVQAGDNLFRIGLLYGCKHEEIASYNNLANPDVLEIGQEIRIPTCE